MITLTKEEELLIEKYIDKYFKRIDSAYIEDCGLVDGKIVDGRYPYILVPKEYIQECSAYKHQ